MHIFYTPNPLPIFPFFFLLRTSHFSIQSRSFPAREHFINPFVHVDVHRTAIGIVIKLGTLIWNRFRILSSQCASPIIYNPQGNAFNHHHSLSIKTHWDWRALIFIANPNFVFLHKFKFHTPMLQNQRRFSPSICQNNHMVKRISHMVTEKELFFFLLFVWLFWTCCARWSMEQSS